MSSVRETYEARSVTMTPEEWRKVETYGRKFGYGSVSAALRRIVNEWWTIRGNQLVTTDDLSLPPDYEPPATP